MDLNKDADSNSAARDSAPPPKDAAANVDQRVHGLTRRGPAIEFMVNGHPTRAHEGETVAAAMLAAGLRVARTTAVYNESRGPYCGIGMCFECVMNIDGMPNLRACQTPVRAGMTVRTQLKHESPPLFK